MNPRLRTRVVALALGSAAAVLVLLSIPVGLVVGQDAREDADLEAQLAVQSVVASVDAGADDAASIESAIAALDDRFAGVDVTVVLASGETVGASGVECTADAAATDDGPDAGASGPGADAGDGGGGPSATSEPSDSGASGPGGVPDVAPIDGGRRASTSVETDAGAVTVCADATTSAWVSALVVRMGAIALAALGVLIVVGLVALVIARRISRPLAAAATTADRLAGGDLDARVPDAGPPEVRRVGEALNRLAGRIEELLRFERETAADLSHRLRTPLTAVRLDVEALPASPERDDLERHVEVLERTLSVVIHAARRPQREGAVASCDAVAVARERYDFWAPLMEDQGRETSFEASVTDAPTVRAAADDLGAALDALLENAVAHTPESTPVRVVVTDASDGLLALDVRDRGPGVPPEALGRGRSDRGSTGLGLDIARSCAEASGGSLELLDVDGWSAVRMLLGR